MKKELNYQDYLDIRLSIASRIQQIQDTMIPICNSLNDDDLGEMYKRELDTFKKLQDKINFLIYAK